MSKEVTKKQHYVPQFYLRRFANDDGLLHILDVKKNALRSPKAPAGIGYAHYFYAADTGIPDDVSQHVEQWLQHFEDAIAKELPSVVEKILGNEHIDENDRYIASVFMSMLWLRSPNMRMQLNKMEEEMTKKIMRFYAPQRVDRYAKDKKPNMTPSQRAGLIKMLETGSYELRFNNAQHLKFMTETLGFGGPGFANMFYGQKWKVHITKGKKRFITSDSPVIEWWPPPQTFYGASFLERNKYFALAPEILLELTFPVGTDKVKRRTIFENEDDDVSLFNILIAAHSHEFAYSGDKIALDALVSGRARPGSLERTYYERFEQPWKEARRTSIVS